MKVGYGASKNFHTPGSMYKRFQMSEARKMNRQAVRAFENQIAFAGPAIFDRSAAASEQRSVLAVKQMAARLADEGQKSLLDRKA